METKVRNGINTLLTFILGILGFSCTSNPSPIEVAYGVPSAEFTLKGRVSNEEKESLSDIQIVLRKGWKDGEDTVYWDDFCDTLYTDAEGKFYRYYESLFPHEYSRIIANDTTGVYASDSIEGTISYSGGDGHWYRGKCELDVEIVMKKKD